MEAAVAPCNGRETDKILHVGCPEPIAARCKIVQKRGSFTWKTKSPLFVWGPDSRHFEVTQRGAREKFERPTVKEVAADR